MPETSKCCIGDAAPYGDALKTSPPVEALRPDGTAIREVDVTFEMIEAGVIELARFDPRSDSFEDAAELIFRSMFSLMR
jgi:hypothetical protein